MSTRTYCKDCSIELFGVDRKQLANKCTEKQIAFTSCAHCNGFIWVDHTGARAEGTTVIPFTKKEEEIQ